MRTEDMDREFEDLRKRMQSYEEQPDEALWKNISKKISKPSNVYLTTSIVAVSALLIGFVGMLVFAPAKNESPVAKTDVKATENVMQIAKEKSVSANIEIVAMESKNNKTDSRNDFVISESVSETPISAVESTQIAKTIEATPVVEKAHKEKKSDVQSLKVEKPVVISEKQVEDVKQVEITAIESKNAPEILTDTVRQRLFIPNAFTPASGDGNSVFKPAYAEVEEYKMFIYNRQGVLLFTSNDISIGWDGTTSAGDAPKGGYVYIIKYKDLKGKAHTEKGSLLLLR